MHKLLICFIAAVLLFAVGGNEANAHTTTMTASWYGPGLQGNLMANGERFDMNDSTVVAHKSLPFGTKLLLRNPENDAIIVAIVQDRGPFIKGRQLDVSKKAAELLGFKEDGVTKLEVEVLE